MSAEMTAATPLDGDNTAAMEAEEFEEITSDEVDRVVEQLEALMESVASENVRFHLEEAADRIHSLIYDDEDDDLADAA